MTKLNIKIKKIRPSAILPDYQTEQAAAMDLCACLDAPLQLQPMERAVVPTGLAMEIPQGYEAQIRARSGLSIKNGICLINGVGTIDADYRGEIGILMVNFGSEAFSIEPGMRVAQMVVARHEVVQWQESTELDDTTRGEGKFGSTGQ
jgi:dUTP pyrophosphatase